MASHRIDPEKDFIREIIHHDLETGKHDTVVTRFPPEPNGYLHIGHAKAICLNFTLAREVDGARCHLRFDDTNPTKEEMEYVEAIKRDVRWLGFDWGKHEYFASDYFETLYEYAVDLIKQGKAYVCDLSPEQIREYRGTLTEPGRESPYRDRPVEENLELFERMRRGEFAEGEKVLRAKIDMAAPNLNMRDPAIYRIRFAHHHRTGDDWCIYPMYDFTHCLSDAIEHVTHSLCSLEFQDHRPLYDWFVDQAPAPAKPRQIEFARLNLTFTVMSKRKLLELVRGGYVDGWDDPRLPTLCGLRRRGFTPKAIRAFCDRIGVAKRDSMVDVGLLEHAVREDLNQTAQRLMAVLDPLKVVITNYPEDQVEELEAINNPEDAQMGARKVPFSRELYIERADFREDPPKKFFRLAPGREVRLRYAYFITCQEVIKDPETGEITELRCTYDPQTRGGSAPDGRKVRGTLHWLSASHVHPIEVRIYDRLFIKQNPSELAEGEDFKDHLNPDSLQVNPNALIEPMGASMPVGENVQFERQGYFCVDPDSSDGKPVYNRTVSLKDTWAKIEQRLEQESPAKR